MRLSIPTKLGAMTALLSLAATACTVDSTDSLGEPDGTAEGALAVREKAGPQVLGATLDALASNATSYASSPATLTLLGGGSAAVSESGGCLVAGAHSCADPWFNGAKLDVAGGAGPVVNHYTIAGSVARANGAAYDVRLDGGARACPVTGYGYFQTGEWTRAGQHTSSGRLSLVCEDDGVAARAFDWGYDPTTPLFTAAVAAGRADYAGDGTGRALEGAAIEVYDVDPSTPKPAPAWPPAAFDFRTQVVAGTAYLDGAWGTALTRATCLTKLRWSTLPVGDYRGLPDPRLPTNPSARFCDDYTYDQLFVTGGTIGVYSVFADRALVRWVNGSGDTLTTTRGFWSQIASQVVTPRNGYDAFQRFEGSILTDDGAALLTQRIPGLATIALSEYHNPATSDRMTSVAGKVPNGYNLVETVGNILPSLPASLPAGVSGVALYRFKKTNGSDYLTTTLSAVAGYASRVQLGYVLRLTGDDWL